MVNLADLKLARVGCREGRQYRSTHDARPTAPDGTIWRVSAVTPEGKVSVWSYNAWGRLYQETSTLDQLFELAPRGTMTSQILREDLERNGKTQMLADVAEARKTDVFFTEDAEAFLYEVTHA